MTNSRHLSTWIDADWQTVYAFASDQRNLPAWAAGLTDPQLALEIVEFAPTNDFGVLDHLVHMPDGTDVFNPMRVIPGGPDAGCEVVFTLRQRPDQDDEQYDSDARMVAADLAQLKAVFEKS